MTSNNLYSYSGVIKTFTVPTTGEYEITAYGGQGGSVPGYAGGLGAEVQGTFSLTKGEVLEILVGGAAPSSTYRGAGGGGGSFVVAEPAGGTGYGTPLVIAGGGGGAYYFRSNHSSGGGGRAGTSGGAGGNAPGRRPGGSGGSNGGGGAGPNASGGGGYTGNGGGNHGGRSFRAGGAGGAYYGGSYEGGFGGGGYGSGGGGGGGGYSGGGGGYNYAGGGGGSFDSGTSQTLIAGEHTGNGLVTIDLLCYLRGTHILTPTGEVFVEHLKIGDLVVTRFGGLQPIKWIGRQSYDARFVKNNREHLPVCIRAGALGDHLPARDLYVSPGHAMLVGGTLVLASSLVNGLTITQDWSPSVIDYFQIELASHDCVIAEGTWSETYGDGPGLRERFHNAAEFADLYPDHAPPDEVALCAPRPLSGARLAAALLPLVERTGACIRPGALRGSIDAVRPPFAIDCWAQDASHPFLPVLLDVLLGDVVIASVLACDHRPDLEQAGIGYGRAAASLTSPVRLKPELLRTLRIRRASDHTELLMTPDCRARIDGMADDVPMADAVVAHTPDLRLVG